MARVNVSIKASIIPSEEAFSGEQCKICGDAIYGVGFRVVLAINVNEKDMPSFKETEVILCTACKNAAEW